MNDIPLLGYSNKLSVRNGETISFKVSSTSKKTFKAYLTYVNSEIEKKEKEMNNLLLLSKYLEKVIEMNEKMNCQDGGGYENKHYSNFRLIQGKHELGKINKQIDHIKHNLIGF